MVDMNGNVEEVLSRPSSTKPPVKKKVAPTRYRSSQDLINLSLKGEITADWFKERIGHQVSDRYGHMFDEFVRITDSTFPGKWELQAQFIGDEITPVVIIHFPEITIKNRESRIIKIFDMFIKFVFKSMGNGFNIPQLMGLRTSITPGQYASGYSHSHLHSITFTERHSRGQSIKFLSFCLGSSSRGNINYTMNQMRNNWNPALYQSFLFQIQPFLEYESLEGGPHIGMRKVTENRLIKLTPKYPFEMMHSFQSTLNNFHSSGLTLMISNGSYVIKDTPSFNNILLTAIPSQYKVVQGINGEYFTSSNSNISVDRFVGNTFATDLIWKGARMPCVVNSVSATNTVGEIHVHPLYKTLFIKFIEGKINDFLCKQAFNIKTNI